MSKPPADSDPSLGEALDDGPQAAPEPPVERRPEPETSHTSRPAAGSDSTITPTGWDHVARARQETPPLEAGTMVGAFEVRRLLGQGGMGRVYLARDSRLGRLVALKLLRPDVVGPERVQRFLDEARTTARFSDAHIVTVYELGQHDGQPFIALEYLDGESLKKRALAQRPAPAEVTRWMLAVARALHAAHSHAVIHCDLKPDNVVLPKDGRLRVVDFGLARAASLAGISPRAGTAAYMAPEQWEGEPLEARTDVWSFGVMLLELLTGANPFRESAGIGTIDELLADRGDALGLSAVPAPLAEVVRACLERRPSARPSAKVLIERLEAIVDRQLGLDSQIGSPFPGLVAFEESQAGLYFGRDTEIDQFLDRLRSRPVLPVIGPSGAGKSSFVRAGVIPRLRTLGPWRVLVVRPGASPLRSLAARLTGLLETDTAESVMVQSPARIDDMVAALRENPRTLLMVLLSVARRTGSRVLLFVDQLEEAFTHEASPEEQRRFMEAVALGADDPDDPVRIVFTARDDFLGRLAEVPEVQAALDHVTVLRRLQAAELREVLTRPLDRVGHAWEDPRVVDEILGELAGEVAGLPLLQFACRALWERRDVGRRLLLRSEFEALGGVGGALAEHADRVLQALSPSQLTMARALMLRLVGQDGTRRVVARASVVRELGVEAQDVVDRLTQSRLIVSRRASAAVAEPTLELAHESLVRTWATLGRWMADSREERALLDELGRAAELWESRGKKLAEVWTGDAVVDAWRRLDRLSVKPPGPVAAFLEAGSKRHRTLVRRRRIALGSAAAVLVAIATASFIAAAEFRDKERQTREQSQRLLAAAADIGAVEIELQPFDWDPETLSSLPVAPAELSGLELYVHRDDPQDDTLPGAPLTREDLTQTRVQTGDGRWIEKIEARAGHAWLRVEGRNRPDEPQCAGSWIRVLRLPGYGTRSEGLRWTIPVPTCRATRAGMIAVPAGPFVHGGRGEPPVRHGEYVTSAETVHLAAFLLDRTETPNALFRLWTDLAPVTGHVVSEIPAEDGFAETRGARYPAVPLSAYVAEQVCMYLGKRLPTSLEWEKAVRGGLTLPDGPNPHPERSVPWGAGEGAMNLTDTDDGFRKAAPVDSMPEGAGPYGHLHLVGNVAEWTATPAEGGRHSLRVIRGGSWYSETLVEEHTHAYENARMPRYFDFGLGVRCAN